MGDIKAIVNGDISVVLYLDGKAHDVEVVAEVLAALLEVRDYWLRIQSRLTLVILDRCLCSWSRGESLRFSDIRALLAV